MLLLRPTLPLLTTASFLTSTFLLTHSLAPPQSRRLLLDSASSPIPTSSRDSIFARYQHDAQTPIVQRRNERNVLNAQAVRQISTGSVAGLLGGLAISLFSRPLAILLGLLIAGVQYCETKGIHVIPYQRLERWFKGVDVRSAVRDNVALKLSFGASFALAGFASF